jgi:hypothetical protein
MVGGSLASWAHGGPDTGTDIDLVIRPKDANRALGVLASVGMRPEHPPESWLFKAWHDGILVDLIFAPDGLEVTEALFAQAETRNVFGYYRPVMNVDDLFATKLLGLAEPSLDYSSVVAMARAFGGSVEWSQLRVRTCSSPYAVAFFKLLEELGLVEGPMNEVERVSR